MHWYFKCCFHCFNQPTEPNRSFYCWNLKLVKLHWTPIYLFWMSKAPPSTESDARTDWTRDGFWMITIYFWIAFVFFFFLNRPVGQRRHTVVQAEINNTFSLCQKSLISNALHFSFNYIDMSRKFQSKQPSKHNFSITANVFMCCTLNQTKNFTFFFHQKLSFKFTRFFVIVVFFYLFSNRILFKWEVIGIT